MFQTPPSYGFGRYGFGFFGPRIAFPATGALWGRATPFFYHFSVHLSSVLGRTELCHEVWTPGPQKPQIINNENPTLGTARMFSHKYSGSEKGVFSEKGSFQKSPFLGPAFGRMDFSRILFLSRRIFSRIFSPDFFSSFLWEKVPRKILQENPRENPSKFIQQKSSNIFLQIAQGNHFLEILENLEILELLENSQTVENKGESDHFLENLEILEILEIPPVKRPLS